MVSCVKRRAAALATVVLLSLAAYAAEVTGTWNAKVDPGGVGATPTTFFLKQDGEKLRGICSTMQGDAPLTGTIKGDKISFDCEAAGVKIQFEGTVNSAGTEMEGTCDFPGLAGGTFKAEKKVKK